MLKPFAPFFRAHITPALADNLPLVSKELTSSATFFAKDKGNAEAAIAHLTAALTKHASVAAAVGKKVAAETGWEYLGVDPTPAPLGDVSIGPLSSLHGRQVRLRGTLTAARIITAAVKAVPEKQVGYSGLMVACDGGQALAQRWAESTYSVDSLLAYSAVCGTGFGYDSAPGRHQSRAMERIYGDVASLATKWTNLSRHDFSLSTTKSRAIEPTFTIRFSSTPRCNHCHSCCPPPEIIHGLNE